MPFRKILFWSHLIGGCAAGAVIVMMSLTGVLLTYEKQILARLERGPFRAAPEAGARRLGPDELLARVEAQRGPLPRQASLVMRAAVDEPAEISLGREGAFYVNAYDGRVLGSPDPAPRRFFQRVTAWHRWFGVEGEGRARARAVTGAANLLFLFLVLSGIYLWIPKIWSWRHVRPIVWFRGGLNGKARDFNWHNVFGIWAAAPLAVVVATALPMSYSWANALIYRMTGTEMPRGGPRGEAGGGAPRPALNALWARAERQAPDWRTITMRVPEGGSRVVEFQIDRGEAGQPQRRGTLTLAVESGALRKWETFEAANAGRQWRMWSRFAHTGEYYGWAGQTVAGLASLSGVALGWTGFALAWRRLAAWRGRRSRLPEVADPGEEASRPDLVES